MHTNRKKVSTTIKAFFLIVRGHHSYHQKSEHGPKDSHDAPQKEGHIIPLAYYLHIVR